MERFRMELESLSKNEEFARVVVTVFMSRLDPTLEEIDDVKTAVSEAVTNAEIHGYGGESGTITVEVEIEGREVTVVVEDYGIGIRDVEKPWNPCLPPTRPEPDPAWDSPLWRRSWIRCMWNRNLAKGQRLS